jgi:hypothetical protein
MMKKKAWVMAAGLLGMVLFGLTACKVPTGNNEAAKPPPVPAVFQGLYARTRVDLVPPEVNDLHEIGPSTYEYIDLVDPLRSFEGDVQFVNKVPIPVETSLLGTEIREKYTFFIKYQQPGYPDGISILMTLA